MLWSWTELTPWLKASCHNRLITMEATYSLAELEESPFWKELLLAWTSSFWISRLNLHVQRHQQVVFGCQVWGACMSPPYMTAVHMARDIPNWLPVLMKHYSWDVLEASVLPALCVFLERPEHEKIYACHICTENRWHAYRVCSSANKKFKSCQLQLHLSTCLTADIGACKYTDQSVNHTVQESRYMIP